MSYNLNSNEVWVIGAGPMALDHVRVLLHLGITPTVIGRGEISAKKFEAETGISVERGGLQSYLKKKLPTHCTNIIIATGTEVLMSVLIEFLNLNFDRILVEKPAAISIEELLESEERLRLIQDRIFVAYNRRHYPSVQKALELIQEDGGLKSMYFEFTEWSHRIENIQKAPGVKENWFFANSTHVIDLAFFIAGAPRNWQVFSKSGTLSWHRKSYFSGAGITTKGVVFSYESNWESAGTWQVILKTERRKISLNPLEKLSVIYRGEINSIDQDLGPSTGLKMGLIEMTKDFLENSHENLCPLSEHLQNTKDIYLKILDV